MGIFLLQILLSMDFGVRVKIYVGVAVLIPALIFAVLGVQGESLFSGIVSVTDRFLSCHCLPPFSRFFQKIFCCDKSILLLLRYLFLGAGLVVILAAGLLIRSRKRRYH